MSQDDASWVLTTYLVANAVVLPVSGWASSLIGRKRFYMTCVALFTLSSALCGMAPNLGTLLLRRVCQGAGGGGLQPSEQSILLDTFPSEKRGMAMAVYGIAVLVAPILGPTLGGYITENYHWRWIFYINIPVGLLSLTLTSLIVEDPPYLTRQRLARRGHAPSIDYIGLGLIALGLGALEIIYDRGEIDDWFGSRFIVTLMAGMAFIFTPINTAAYLYIPEEQHNNATALFNLVRNEGASLGIALVTTLVERRSQFHQNRLSESFNRLNPIFQNTWDQVAQLIHAAGYEAVTAKNMALGRLYRQLLQQAQLLAYLDLFWLFSMAAFAVIPLVFLMRRSVSEKGAIGGH